MTHTHACASNIMLTAALIRRALHWLYGPLRPARFGHKELQPVVTLISTVVGDLLQGPAELRIVPMHRRRQNCRVTPAAG